jgi:hypothetical protein
MKKLLLSSVFGFAALGVSAQSFNIVDANSQNVTNGSTLTYYVDQATALETHDFEVHNTSSNAVTAKVRKAIQSQADPGCTFYFCTDQNCYTPNTVLSGNVNMTAGGSFQLITDFTPNNATGTSLVRYSVFNTSNPSDSVFFFIQYVVSPNSVNTLSMVKASIGTPNPNPASSVFSLNYNLGSSFGKGEAKLVIYNMLGAVVRTETVTDIEGTIKMDVSTLENGVYFTSMEVGGKQVATKRLVVTH